jgi:hypothetical protein
LGASTVDIDPVIDMDDVEAFELFLYGIDDSVAAAASTTKAGQLPGQRTADSQRLFGQWTENEFQTGSANLLGEANQITFGAN